MSWKLITDDWRLKLLALGLAILMLGAVAFSQNPPTSRTLTKGLTYNVGTNPVVLINPPSKIPLTITGLADLIAIVTPDNIIATVDASHAKPGSGVKLDVTVSSTIGGVKVQQPAPIVLDIDSLQSKELQVQVNARAGPGWSITKSTALCPSSPCIVHFSGPVGWEKNMTASVAYPNLVQASSGDSLNQPIQLQNSNGVLDLATCHTQPCVTLDTLAASVHVEAVAGSTSSTVALLDAPPSHGPANGYRITAVAITPNTVTISGDPVALGRVRNVMLPSVDLTGRTSDATFTVAIPYPDGISGSVATATVKYSISANPNASPSPGA